MTALNNKREIRFCVGNKQHVVSLIWKLFVNKDDVYILARSMGTTWKISLHKSGICRVAFNRPVDKVKDRLVAKWNKIYAYKEISPNIAFLIPYVNLQKALDKNIENKNKKEVFYINPPKENEKIIIKVFFAINDKTDFNRKMPNKYKKLFEYKLKNGEIVYLISWVEKLLDSEVQHLKDQLSKFEVNVISEKAKKKTKSIFAVWVNDGIQQTHGQPTIVNYPLGFEHLKVRL